MRRSRLIRTIAALTAAATAVIELPALPVHASTVTSATFTGGAGTANVDGTLYAKNLAPLTLTVVASGDTKCVDVVAVTGAFSGHQTSSTAKRIWTFGFTAGNGNGIQTVTAAASPDFNANNKCTGQSQNPQNASFVLDNTAPVVTGTLSPAPNAAGWHNSNVGIAWSAADAGSGVASGPTPATDSVTANTATLTKPSTATDRVGNTGTGSVTVKLDKAAPTITGSRSPAANPNGWNNANVTASFICSDGLSGIKSCAGPTTLSTSAANQSVTGTATDNADNSNAATVGPVNIDKVVPTLTGAATTSPNGAGWYKADVVIDWTPSDALSGVDPATDPVNSTISGEGPALNATASVSDRAGNSTTATSPTVKIDRTAPVTLANAPSSWNNTDVTVALTPTDGLSGVASTTYSLNGGPALSGTGITRITISAQGIHTLTFSSTDVAGNAEPPRTVQVKIDKTPPTINHTQLPLANGNGWNNANVTVTFICADALSGIASCTTAQTVTTEGQNQAVPGTAIDNAGNSARDPAKVSIDKTGPAIDAARQPLAGNANGWNNTDVTVSFACTDALSGIDTCSPSQTLGEGSGQSALGTAVDNAGNATSTTLSGINVDKTAPTLGGSATPAPNANGWNRGDVTVSWSCGDGLSGIDGTCPDPTVVTGEGDDLSASESVADMAGNAANTTVSGIRIDRTAPSTHATPTPPTASGWYRGAAGVTVEGVDGLSGIAATFYSVDGGAPKTYGGPFDVTANGIHTVTVWSTDNAGNIEDRTAAGNTITLQIDNQPPTITGSRIPAANGFGWNSGPVNVTFACDDPTPGSGLAGCAGDTQLANEGAGQSATGNAADNAGNTAAATVSGISIDLTPPNLTGAATTSPNAAGWYKGNVTIQWTGQDGLSGIDPATTPTDATITGEGAALGATATVSDKAGNPGSGTVSDIRIDRTNPTISGAPTTAANAAGWYKGAVTVHFACADALSGLQECAGDVVLDQNGSGQSTTGAATDMADNPASATVSGINIDARSPETVGAITCTGKNGWCRNTATITLDATDQAGLSGVQDVYYRFGTSGPFTRKADPVTFNLPLRSNGRATLEFYAIDRAGNEEPLQQASIKYDTISPSISFGHAPGANAAGWNRANVDVLVTATDPVDGVTGELGSGVEELTVDGSVVGANTTSGDQTPLTFTKGYTAETPAAGTVLNASAEDFAGNIGSDADTVKIDKTAPTFNWAATAAPNPAGWYRAPVTVSAGTSCADALSGIAECAENVVLTANGAGQSATGTTEDRADNTLTRTAGPFNIDAVAPTIGTITVANGGIYPLGTVPSASCTASDTGGSGLAAPCAITVTGGNANGVGTFSFVASATDVAGNPTTSSGAFRVVYRWDGFLQPINDTAHQIGLATSIFKAGSTVPVKFQLRRAGGTPVQSAALPVWLTPVKGSATTAAIDEIAYTDPSTPGGSYRWDATAQQYIYNWGTSKGGAGNYWRIGVSLDDGNTYYVNIGLR